MNALALLLWAGTAWTPRPEAVRADVVYSHRVWQSADGLPEDLAQALAQTPDGYLWIGTSGGLVRFDGVRFAMFHHGNEPAFADDSVYTLYTSRDGTLWAGTEGGGLVRYRGGAFRAFGAADGLGNPFVRVVFEDREGTLWVGTDGGLFRREGERFVRIDGTGTVPEMNVHSICQDRAGRLLIGGWGLLVLEAGRSTYYGSRESLADNAIRAIRETADGTVWIGTVSGLRRLPQGLRGDPFRAPRALDGVNIAVLRETARHELWIGTYGGGVMRLRDDRLLTLRAPAALPHDNVLAIFEDAESNVWVGTQGGLLRLSPAAARTVTAASGAPLSINTIYEDPQGGLWVTALNGRLFRVAGESLVPAPLPAGLSALPIRNLFRDSKGRLWLGTDGQGVARISGSEVRRYTMKEGLVNEFVRAFCEDREGGIWIGTDGGLSHWRAGSFHNFSTANGLVYTSIRGLLLDRQGDLWVATEGGLNRFRGGATVEDPRLLPLRGQKVWALHEDPEGGLWIGTQGAGLFRLEGGGLRQFTTAHGLPSDKIDFIAEDRHGNLWMSGPGGIVSVSRRELESLPRGAQGPLPVRLFGTPEGLATNQMNGGVQPAGCLTRAGELWFPSTKGAVRIAPDTPERSGPLPVVIENVLADDRPVGVADGLRLPPGEGKLEIHYTSIRLASPERVRFQYRMEGLDKDWTMAGTRRVAYYTNLPPGRYRFQVVAHEVNAPAHSAERTLGLEWRPHFHQTRWFVALCGALLGGLAWGGYRLHVRSIRRQFAAVLEERNRLAREMHDTLIQGCVGVSTLLEAASRAHEVSPDLGPELLDRARTEVRRTVEEARLAVWDLRHGSGAREDLLPAVRRLADQVGREGGLPVRVEAAGTPRPLDPQVAHHVMMLIREALQNAVRHAAPRNLSVVLRFDRRRLRVEVQDDGRGFDCSAEPSAQTPHYGLIGMRERVEEAGGEFRLLSAPGRGTSVRLSIPVGRSAR